MSLRLLLGKTDAWLLWLLVILLSGKSVCKTRQNINFLAIKQQCNSRNLFFSRCAQHSLLQRVVSGIFGHFLALLCSSTGWSWQVETCGSSAGRSAVLFSSMVSTEQTCLTKPNVGVETVLHNFMMKYEQRREHQGYRKVSGPYIEDIRRNHEINGKSLSLYCQGILQLGPSDFTVAAVTASYVKIAKSLCSCESVLLMLSLN